MNAMLQGCGGDLEDKLVDFIANLAEEKQIYLFKDFGQLSHLIFWLIVQILKSTYKILAVFSGALVSPKLKPCQRDRYEGIFKQNFD